MNFMNEIKELRTGCSCANKTTKMMKEYLEEDVPEFPNAIIIEGSGSLESGFTVKFKKDGVVREGKIVGISKTDDEHFSLRMDKLKSDGVTIENGIATVSSNWSAGKGYTPGLIPGKYFKGLNLKEIHLPETIKQIGLGAFEGNPDVKIYPSGKLNVPQQDFEFIRSHIVKK